MTVSRRVYCDRLSPTRSIPLARALKRLGVSEVRVLDPIAPGWRGRIARRLLALYGVTATEQPFYAGHLDTPDGIPATRAAAERAMATALPEMGRIVAASPALDALNRKWGRNTIWLQLCKSIAMTSSGDQSLFGYALRTQVARALAMRDGQQTLLLVETPSMFGLDCLQAMAPEITIAAYGSLAPLLRSKIEVLRQGARLIVRRIRGMRAAVSNAPRLAAFRQQASERPGVLVLQEDDLGSDRSYRSQPSWLFSDDPAPAFNTFVLAYRTGAPAPATNADLTSAHVAGLSNDDLLALARSVPAIPTVAAARADARQCWWRALASSEPAEATALALASRLLTLAAELAAATRQLNVRAFMTAENYLVAGDAMTLVGERLGIHTLSYQYTNIALRSPLMMTTADVMFSLAPGFHTHWRYEGIAPRAFVDVGYPFDAAFALVRQRATGARQKLRAAGATCVVAYYDENFFVGTKYGLTTYEEHCDELRRLLERVVSDPSFGLVTKVQFQRNSASRIPSLQALVTQAESTGRYLELVKGEHRNVVLPSEAALMADIAIGHAVGGTASLEAALAGARSIVVNPYRMRDANQPLYARADLQFPSLDAALAAIDEYRAGNRPLLGDWSTLLPHMDAFRDGAAARRIRRALDLVTADDAPAAGSAEVGQRLAREMTATEPGLKTRPTEPRMARAR